jgi:tRNA nucleotidyltransferase (CCA-adding enzyme)
MAREESAEVNADPARAPLAFLRQHAAWLFEPALATCLVGSQALAEACRRAGIAGPEPLDIDLAWGLDIERGRSLLVEKGVFVPTTTGNVDRGTLALKVAGRRLELTTFRAGDTNARTAVRIAADLAERDMTIGAIAIALATDTVHDPCGGLADWQARVIRPVGDPAQRVREHPIRWLRYYRKASELDAELDRSIRRLALPHAVFEALPKEAVALELRAILGKCRSPGRCLHDLHEDRLLAFLLPEVDLQFDGRPAGPQRWHPEISQALHLILALEWAAQHTQQLDERDRLAVLIAVLCHDLGKGYTDPQRLPQHLGHERDGLPHVDRTLERWPGFADQKAWTLARHVCALHVEARNFAELRAGTLAELYESWFRGSDYPVELFALAIGADVAGRLGCEADGPRIVEQVQRDVRWLREVCGGVDATALRAQHPELPAFRAALHEARAQRLAKQRRH